MCSTVRWSPVAGRSVRWAVAACGVSLHARSRLERRLQGLLLLGGQLQWHRSQLFGDKRDLFVIHNMGRSCPACTLWADIADRAAFVVSSPDSPDVQRAFAASRGWRFPMVSHQGASFAEDMGYGSESGGWLAGVSVFKRDGARILRTADTRFQPSDDFCSVWHLLDLLPEGADGWRPKFSYS
jgi:predicted dithiol-disulfide oxidoreductase (DUF899 family)